MKNNVSTSFLWPVLLSTLALCAAQACGSNSERALRMNAPEDEKRQPPVARVSMLEDQKSPSPSAPPELVLTTPRKEVDQKHYRNKQLETKQSATRPTGDTSSEDNAQMLAAYQQRAEELKMAQDDTSQYTLALCYYKMGAICYDQRAYKTAKGYYLKSLVIQSRLSQRHPRPEIAILYSELGEICLLLGDSKTAKQYIQKALEISKLVSADKAHTGLMRCCAAMHAAQVSEQAIAEASEYYEEASRVLLAPSQLSAAQMRLLLGNLGATYFYQRRYGRALLYYQKTLDSLQTPQDDTAKTEAATCYSSIAMIHRCVGNDEQSITYHGNAIALLSQLDDNVSYTESAMSYGHIGDIHNDKKNYAQAIKAYKKAIEIGSKVDDDTLQYHIAQYHVVLGDIHHSQRADAYALSHYSKAVSALWHIRKKEEVDEALLQCYHRLIELHSKRGNWQAVVACYTPVLYLERKRSQIQASPRLAKYLFALGEVHYKLGDYARAKDRTEQALEHYKNLYGDRAHPGIAACYSGLGRVYIMQGEEKKAIYYYEKALNKCLQPSGDESFSELAVADTFYTLGYLYQHQEDYQQAEKYFSKAYAVRKAYLGADNPLTRNTAKYMYAARMQKTLIAKQPSN